MHKRFQQYICQYGYGFKFSFSSFNSNGNFVSFENQPNYECVQILHILKSRWSQKNFNHTLRDCTFQKWNNLEGN